jgi:hypothetical protein
MLQVDECGFPIPRTLARMAEERSVRLVFGPKRGQWRIEADLAKEARIINKQTTKGHAREQSILARNKSQQGQRAASMRALSMLQGAGSMRSTTSTDSGQQQRSLHAGSENQDAPESPLDPARLLLPISGSGKEALRDELAFLQPIDDSSASDQVSMYLVPRVVLVCPRRRL